MNVESIEYTIRLTPSEIEALALALAKACSYETQNLRYIEHCEDVRSDPAICGYRSTVAYYLRLRNDLLDLTKDDAAEERADTNKFDQVFFDIVDEWNKEIARIKGGHKP